MPGARSLSLWQPARSFPDGTCICREDLLGGYKARKYQSLIPSLKTRGIFEVLLRGSSHSNNVLQLALRLKQEGIRPFYALEGRDGPTEGNGLFSRLAMGADFLDEGAARANLYEIAEGASCLESLPGALTLAASVGENALVCGVPAQIYIEAGSGFSAAALILGLGFLGLDCSVRVVWLGDAGGDFEAVLQRWRPCAEKLLDCSFEPAQWEVVRPSTARSFGSVNRAVLDEVALLAREEGLLVDPIYTAKLFLTARELYDKGPALLFCGGGAFELSGFQGQLARYLAL